MTAARTPRLARHLRAVEGTNPRHDMAGDFSLSQATVRAFGGRTAIAGANVRYAFFEADQPIEDVPMLIIKGYIGTTGAYAAFARALARNGRHAVVGEAVRHQTRGASWLPAHLHDVLKVQSQANLAIMRAVERRTGHNRFDLIGHSMGTPIGSKLAVAKPEYVRSLMCTGGAGLDGPSGFARMVQKAGDVVLHEIVEERGQLMRSVGPATALATAHYIFREPLRTLREGHAAASFDARPNLQEARENGIRVGALLFEADTFFNPFEVLEHSGAYFDWVRVLENAKHIHPQLHPEQHAQEQIRASIELNHPLALIG